LSINPEGLNLTCGWIFMDFTANVLPPITTDIFFADLETQCEAVRIVVGAKTDPVQMNEDFVVNKILVLTTDEFLVEIGVPFIIRADGTAKQTNGFSPKKIKASESATSLKKFTEYLFKRLHIHIRHRRDLANQSSINGQSAAMVCSVFN
jgi:hypothetical protein